ncbi:MAG: hypothetical protein M0Q26_11390 [Chitinophagaceae bacterium]|nr:hypothetical protein [Chitinophagaceae bacterium]
MIIESIWLTKLLLSHLLTDFILVLNAQYSTIGLLVTAKSIIPFNEKDRWETKTKYLVIGILLSVGMVAKGNIFRNYVTFKPRNSFIFTKQ